MSTRQELFERGEAVRRQLQHGSHTSSGRANSTVPGVSRLTTEAVFGGIWARPGLSLEARMMCTLSALSVLQRLPQLRTYIHSALTLGLAPRAIQEIFVQCAIYGGFPTMVNAISLAHEVFAERGITVPETTLPEASLEELEAQGKALRLAMQGSSGQTGYASGAKSLASDLFQMALQYGYGDIWYRPGLDHKSRVLCALSAFTVLWCEPQLRGFLKAALSLGWQQAEIVEIIMHTAPYGGFPRALNALTLAQEVLGT